MKALFPGLVFSCPNIQMEQHRNPRCELWMYCVCLFLLTDDPSSEENGDRFTRECKVDHFACIWNDQRQWHFTILQSSAGYFWMAVPQMYFSPSLHLKYWIRIHRCCKVLKWSANRDRLWNQLCDRRFSGDRQDEPAAAELPKVGFCPANNWLSQITNFLSITLNYLLDPAGRRPHNKVYLQHRR